MPKERNKADGYREKAYEGDTKAMNNLVESVPSSLGCKNTYFFRILQVFVVFLKSKYLKTYLAFCSFIRTFETVSRKYFRSRKLKIFLVFCSFIRTFA